MRIDGGSNCHDFWGKHLFYILFVRPISGQVDGSSTFSDTVVGMVPVMLTYYTTLHSLEPAYWNPHTKQTISTYEPSSFIEVFVGLIKLYNLAPSETLTATILPPKKS